MSARSAQAFHRLCIPSWVQVVFGCSRSREMTGSARSMPQGSHHPRQPGLLAASGKTPNPPLDLS
jgi:hypothetical protein